MANKIKFEKDIYVRDKYGIRRKAFVAGSEEDAYVLDAVARNNEILNPKDLPQEPNPANAATAYSKPFEPHLLEQDKGEFKPNHFERPPQEQVTAEQARPQTMATPAVESAKGSEPLEDEPTKVKVEGKNEAPKKAAPKKDK